jgi:hypothetical protein
MRSPNVPSLKGPPKNVIPAQAGIQKIQNNWTPAFAGVTNSELLKVLLIIVYTNVRRFTRN